MTATISGDGTSTLINLTTSGNTILGDASTDTLNVGNGGLVKDASGNVGIGTASPAYKLDVAQTSGDAVARVFANATTTSSRVEITNGDGTTALNYSYLRFINSKTSSQDWRFGTYGNNNLSFVNVTAGTTPMTLDSSGNLLVGQTATSGRVGITSATTDNTTYAIYARDSGTTELFYVRSDGVISTGAKAGSPYNNTTASAANTFVGAGGALQRSTSSLKYKTNVQDATHGLNELLTLRPVTYEGKTDGDKVFGGLIAEEVHEAGLTEFVQYAEDGSPDALAYGNMVSLCIKAIQEMKAIIDTQASTITQLQADVEALKAQP